MKLRSHWLSVTPSARVLVRYPLQVILSVEAAFPSTIMPKRSTKRQTNVRRFSIATTAQKVAGICVILAKGASGSNGITNRSLRKNFAAIFYLSTKDKRGSALMIVRACHDSRRTPGLPFSRSMVGISQTPSGEISHQRMSLTFCRLCAVNSRTRMKAPYTPASSAVRQMARNSLSSILRWRFRLLPKSNQMQIWLRLVPKIIPNFLT
jgi:hypothetical protein